uniref:Tr-type G domain-containing protein n=1 Tax=Plectus sambesii TaxID=2011161 RepID=A0A914VLF7_9BILA
MAGDPSNLPPEDEEGNVEYKLKLVNPTASRLQHLVTQLKWRLREGQGEAIYEIGVEDDGVCKGLSDNELQASLATLRSMADFLGASMVILRERDVTPEPESLSEGAVRPPRHRIAEVLLRKVPDNQQFIELRVAVLGCADAGKSTLLGVLTQGELDNGRGKARLNLFRHLHEVQTGRTSSISLDVVGFDETGEMINYAEHSLEEVVEKAKKLVTLIDLAGHHKYLKTTIYGLTGHKPHFVMLVVAANTGPVGTAREHLGLAMALNFPVIVVVTKADVVTPVVLNRTLTSVETLLKGPGCKRFPLRINSVDDAMGAGQAFDHRGVVPIFVVSSVTGQNLDLLERFLNVLPPNGLALKDQDELCQKPTLMHIDEIFNVPQIGIVACGLLNDGVVREGDELLAGPDTNGAFHPVIVDSLQRNKQPCRVVRAGQAASVSISFVNNRTDVLMRKGMVLAAKELRPKERTCREFEARVYILFHPSPEICCGFQTTVHIGNVCQTATIVKIDKDSLKPGDSATVRFCFYRQPEFVVEGARLIFREGKTKGMGEVTRVFDHTSTSSASPPISKKHQRTA